MFVGRYDDERSKRDAIQISDTTMKSRCNVNVTFGVNPNGVNSWYDGSPLHIYILGVANGSWFEGLLRFLGPTKLGK